MEKEKLFIERKAADNKYLHRDFFVTGDIGIAYVGETYGDEAVKEYLEQYAKSYYSLLIKEVEKQGLQAIKDYFANVYKKEEWSQYLCMEITSNMLTVTVEKCPAVMYMKSIGHTPSKWYKETVYTVYKTLANMCGLAFKVEYYDEKDGSTKFIFKRIEK